MPPISLQEPLGQELGAGIAGGHGRLQLGEHAVPIAHLAQPARQPLEAAVALLDQRLHHPGGGWPGAPDQLERQRRLPRHGRVVVGQLLDQQGHGLVCPSRPIDSMALIRKLSQDWNFRCTWMKRVSARQARWAPLEVGSTLPSATMAS
jgi:hypothetical protein